MEREYKWIIESKVVFNNITNSDIVLPTVYNKNDIHMQAIYYDTESRLLAKSQGALRLRKENDISVCCLKLAEKGQSACKTRNEYEVEAQDIYSGLDNLASLSDIGEYKELCMTLRKSSLIERCRTDFIRNAYHLNISMPSGVCDGELACDIGKLSCKANSVPLCEIEFEYKFGDLQSFHDFANKLEKTFSLIAQPLSKMARAISL